MNPCLEFRNFILNAATNAQANSPEYEVDMFELLKLRLMSEVTMMGPSATTDAAIVALEHIKPKMNLDDFKVLYPYIEALVAEIIQSPYYAFALSLRSALNKAPDPDDTIGDDSDSDPDDTYDPEAEIEEAIQSVKEHVLEKSKHYEDHDFDDWGSSSEEFEVDSDVDIEDWDCDENGRLIPYYARPRVNFMNLVCDRLNDSNRQRRVLSDKGDALIDEWFLVQGDDVQDELKTAFNEKLTESFKDPGFMYADNQPVKNWGGPDESSYDWISKDILEPIVQEVLNTYLTDTVAFPREHTIIDLDESFVVEETFDSDSCCPCDAIFNILNDTILKLPLDKLALVKGDDKNWIHNEVVVQIHKRHLVLIENDLLDCAQQRAREARRVIRRQRKMLYKKDEDD